MEFEVENLIQHYGTYLDKVVVQSGSSTDISGRYQAGSKVSGSYAWHYYDKFSACYLDLANPFRMDGASKFLHLENPQECFYDSLVPSFIGISAINVARFVTSSFDSALVLFAGEPYLPDNILKLIISTGGSGLTGSDGAPLTDNEWYNTYPFEYRYTTVPRLSEPTPEYRVSFLQEDLFITSGFNTGTLDYTAATGPEGNRYVLAFSYGGNSSFALANYYDKSGSVTSYSPPAFTSVYTLPLNFREFNMGYYGFGHKGSVSYNVEDPPISLKFTNVAYYYFFGLNISGWKYGLYSGLPSYSHVVYRGKKFGQFRDRLEQRLYTKFFDGKFVKEGPVKISFVSGTVDYVSASGDPTIYNPNDSGIYTTEYTSGKPFFDS